MKFLVGPALNSRNYHRRVCNKPSVCGMQQDAFWGHRTCAAEDGNGKAVQGNEALLSAALASNKNQDLMLIKIPVYPH